MNRFKSVIILAVALVICVFVISGCNTVEGFGKDVERTGEALQDAAN